MRDDCPLVLLLSWANRATTQRLVLTDLSGGGNPQVGRHAHEVGDGIGLHLPEHLAAMNLDCALCNAEVIAHLFVQLPTDQVCEYFSLARSDVTDPESGSSPSVPTLALSRFNVMRVGLMRWIRYFPVFDRANNNTTGRGINDARAIRGGSAEKSAK